MIELNKIYQGDCLEEMRKLPDKSIDLILTDPPYNMKMDGGGCFENRQYWKDIPKQQLNLGFNLNILKEYKRVLKNMNLIIFCSKDQLLDYLLWCKENNYLWILITWNKINPIPATNNTYLPDTEYIFHIRENGLGLNGNYETKKRYYISKIEKNKFNILQ